MQNAKKKELLGARQFTYYFNKNPTWDRKYNQVEQNECILYARYMLKYVIFYMSNDI